MSGYQNWCYQIEDSKVRRLPIDLEAGENKCVVVLENRCGPGGLGAMHRSRTDYAK
jgi:hypothetical protein